MEPGDGDSDSLKPHQKQELMTQDQETKLLQWHEKTELTCLKTCIRFYYSDGETSASKLLLSEQDKLKFYPELVELLKEIFPTYQQKIDSKL